MKRGFMANTGAVGILQIFLMLALALLTFPPAQGASAPPSFTINDVSAKEGNSGTTSFVFTVTLNRPRGSLDTVDYSVQAGSASPGSDFIPSSGQLALGKKQPTQTITVMVLGDLMVEPDETFVVHLSNPSDHTTIDKDTGHGTILDDDFCATGPGDIVWTANLAGSLSSPSQSDGSPAWVLVDGNGIVSSLDASCGRLGGSIPVDGSLSGPPATAHLEDGKLAAFVATSSGFVHRIDVDSSSGALTLVWSRDLRRMISGGLVCASDQIRAAPVIHLRTGASEAFRSRFSSDVVYAATYDGCADQTHNRVYALNALDGTPLWVFNADGFDNVGGVNNAPALDRSVDRLYLATQNGPGSFGDSLFAISVLDGRLVWSTNAGSLIAPPAAVGARVYVASDVGILVAFDAAGNGVGGGSSLWSIAVASVGSGFFTPIGVIVISGTVYLAVVDGAGVVSLILDGGAVGVLQWSRVLLSGVLAITQVIVMAGVGGSPPKLFVGADDGYVYQLSFGGVVEARRIIDGIGSRPSDDGVLVLDAAPDGSSLPRLLFGSNLGLLVKFSIPWPVEPPPGA